MLHQSRSATIRTKPIVWRCPTILAIVIGAAATAGCRGADPEAESLKSVETYVATVAERLSAGSAPEDAVAVSVDPSARVAVYLTPEGSIRISRGFLFAAAGESELACAIAHEMAHKDALAELPDGDSAAAVEPGPRAWPHDVERAADETAAELCWRAGYDPRSLAILLSRLADMLRRQHPEEAQSVEERANALHAFLNGRDWTGELGYRKYRSIVRSLQSGTAANAADDAVERIIVGPILQQAAWWHEYLEDLYDDGNAATGDFVRGECENWNIVPNNEFDAFGHCWYGCEGTRRLGEPQTWFLGTLREDVREFERKLGIDDHDSYAQDVANQGRGRSMADEEGSCLDLCTDAAHQGLLDFSAPERAYFDCETGEMSDAEEDSEADGSGWPWMAQSWGDPHIVTGDGYAYDFQAAGEFVAIESRDDDLSVQVRQEFWPDGQTVSQNTAVAARVHDDVVGFYVVDNQLLVRINRETYEVPENWGSLPGGGEIRSGFEGVHVRWRDGSEMEVRAFGDFLNLFFEPAGARAGEMVGLLGNFDGSFENDLATRDGSMVTLPGMESADYAEMLYGRFGDSWRISPDESMFEYPDGMSAADFQGRTRPTSFARVSALDASTRDAAATICRAAGIRSQPTLDNCIVDVGTTGEALFAMAAADAASTSGHRDKTATLSRPGTHVIDRFIATAGDHHFFQTLELTGSLDLSRWELVAPDGEAVFGQCLRCNQPGEVELPASGVYVSRVVISDQESGRIRTLSHRVPAEQVFDIELPARISADSPQVGAGRIERAGAQDAYRFQGAAGERWRIVLESADLGLGFGEWSLSEPEGDHVFQTILPLAPSLPVDVELPRSGMYALRITGGARWPALTDAGYGGYSLTIDAP